MWRILRSLSDESLVGRTIGLGGSELETAAGSEERVATAKVEHFLGKRVGVE